jgi:hypothetical protein
MRYSDISPTMRAFLGAFEAFRKMGFLSDNIFCMVSRSVRLGGELGAFCVLKTQGKEFSIDCGPVTSEKDAGEEYQRVSKAVSAGEVPQEDLDRIWWESEACQRSIPLVLAIQGKGFRVPGDKS